MGLLRRANLGWLALLGFTLWIEPSADLLQPAGTMTVTITVGGNVRSATIVVPTTRATALVFWFHGDGGSGPGLQRGVHFEREAMPSSVVAYPSGANGSWDLESPTATNEDVELVVKLAEKLRKDFDIPQDRVVAAGTSNGGYFINTLACRVPGLLRAIVSHSGGAPYETPAHPLGRYPNGYFKCVNDQQPVAMMAVHGRADQVVEFSNGELSTKYWAYVAGCGSTRHASAKCEAFDGCPSRIPVVLCPIDGMGHSFAPHAAAMTAAFFSRVLAD